MKSHWWFPNSLLSRSDVKHLLSFYWEQSKVSLSEWNSPLSQYSNSSVNKFIGAVNGFEGTQKVYIKLQYLLLKRRQQWVREGKTWAWWLFHCWAGLDLQVAKCQLGRRTKARLCTACCSIKKCFCLTVHDYIWDVKRTCHNRSVKIQRDNLYLHVQLDL